MLDKSGEIGAAAMLTSAQEKEISYAAGGALLSLASASPCRPWAGASDDFSGRYCRWALAWAFSLVVHGFVFILLWGIRLPTVGVHSSSRAAIFLSLLSSRSAQSDTSSSAISAALPEQRGPLVEQHQKGANPERKAKSKTHESRSFGITKNIMAEPLFTSRSKSVATPLSTPQTLPAGGLEASTRVATTAASEDRAAPQNQVPDSSAGQGEGHFSKGVVGEKKTAPLPVSEVAEAPVLISRTVPHYPDRARLLGIEGLVRLEAILNREGQIEQEIKVLESVPLLDEAASMALRQWRFKPARDDSGRPVRVIVEVPFRFTLK